MLLFCWCCFCVVLCVVVYLVLSQIKKWSSLTVKIRLAAITENIYPTLNLSTKGCLSPSKQFKVCGSSHMGFLGSSAPNGDPGFWAPSVLCPSRSEFSEQSQLSQNLPNRQCMVTQKGVFLAQPGNNTHFFCHTSLISLARPQITVKGERGTHAI